MTILKFLRVNRHFCYVLTIAPSLFTLLLFLAACGPRDVAEADPYARHRLAMKEPFQDHLDNLGAVPRYKINMNLDPSGELLHGTAKVTVYNSSVDPWTHVIFRLYPMLTHYGGNMVIQNILVDGKNTYYSYRAQHTALRVSLPESLLPNKSVQVTMSWRLEIPTWSDQESTYALFGKSQQMTSLPLFYPSLAVYTPGPALGFGRWWEDMGSVRGDSAFNPTALFVVTATLPADQVPVASGTLVTSTLLSEGQARHVWVTGPSREFLLHTSAQFTSAYTEAYGTRVTSYWLPGQEASGRMALSHAIASLRIFSDEFGPYPYRDLRIAPAPLNFRGMEYPQVSLLGVQVYGRLRGAMESLIAHEVAHQWWYQMVHNDPVNMPWIDEALAEYSLKLYIEALYGARAAANMQTIRWQGRVNSLTNNSIPIDQSVDDFNSSPAYETIVYSKGALFYDSIRDIMGRETFNQFLRQYLIEHRYQIVDTADWVDAMVALDNPAINDLFIQWIQNPASNNLIEEARTRREEKRVQSTQDGG